MSVKPLEYSQSEYIFALSNILTDKQITQKYKLRTSTITEWKRKNLNDEDAWKRIAYEFFVRYFPENDIFVNQGIENNETVNIRKNITLMQIGDKNYQSFLISRKIFKLFLASIIRFTPTIVLEERIKFIIHCIESRCMDEVN